jgi:hypothetical protein
MADKIATQTSLLVSSGTFVGGVLSLSDLAMIVGIFGTLVTLYLTWLYKKRSDDREKVLHDLEIAIRHAELKKLKDGCDAQTK